LKMYCKLDTLAMVEVWRRSNLFRWLMITYSPFNYVTN
jgi:hypothetical protein